MGQLTLFDPPPAAACETSRAAAESIGHAAGNLRQVVLTWLRDRGDAGATDHEIAAALRLQLDTSRARRCQLRDAGLVRDSGRTRPSPSGHRAIVWIVAAAGVDRRGPEARPAGVDRAGAAAGQPKDLREYVQAHGCYPPEGVAGWEWPENDAERGGPAR